MLSLAHQDQPVAGGLAANVHAHHQERLQAAGATREQYPHALEYYHLDQDTYNKRMDQ